MTYVIRFARRSQKELLRLPKNMRERVKSILRNLQSNPMPNGCKKLEGDNPLYRIRIGNYRIVYTIEKSIRIVTIIRIGHRGGVYNGL